MAVVLLFAVTLFIAVLLSGRTKRSVISTALLFLVAGFFASNEVFKFAGLEVENELVRKLSELALFSVLFTEGLNLDVHTLIDARRLPMRALIVGIPLTIVIVAGLAHVLLGFAWVEALIVAAALSPTDPVLASALIGQEDVPSRMRNLLNIESGLNDGLALPIVLVLVNIAREEPLEVQLLLTEVALGIVLGVVVPYVALKLSDLMDFDASSLYNPFDAFSIALSLYALSALLPANEFLAAFAAGITIATISPEVRNEFDVFGERMTELIKLAAIMVFGALISLDQLLHAPLALLVFAVLILGLVRPLVLGIALLGTRITRQEWIVVGWFGPKGFASVFYGMYILQSGIPEASSIFHTLVMVIVLSIAVHSSTAGPIAQRYARASAEHGEDAAEKPPEHFSEDDT